MFSFFFHSWCMCVNLVYCTWEECSAVDVYTHRHRLSEYSDCQSWFIFCPRFLLFSLYFFFHTFFTTDWSLYSVTWRRQGLVQFSPHHVTHSELFNMHGLTIKFPLVLYFFPLKMLYIDSIDALAFWTVLQISEEGRAWYEQNIQSIFLMPEAPLNLEM